MTGALYSTNGIADESRPVGRVGCPPGQEANVDEFYFWVAKDTLVEQTQIVRVQTRMGDKDVTVFGVVEQVYRRSAISSMQMEAVAYNRDPVFDDLLLESHGVTYAKARVINTEPSVLAPPVEGSTVCTCNAEDAQRAYEMTAYSNERGVCVGLIRNGGEGTAGPAYLDQDFLLGAQAGHLNVNGAAGTATKSSFLTIAAYQTLRAVKERATRMVGSGDAPKMKAIIFNVKGYDLFWLDRASRNFSDADRAIWRQMGVSDPGAFNSIAYYAPADAGSALTSTNTPRKGDVRGYSWSLADIIDYGLFDLLFSEETRANENLVTLINTLARKLSASRKKARRTAPAENGDAPNLWGKLGVSPPAEPLLPENGRAPLSDAAAIRDQLTASSLAFFDSANGLGVRTFANLLDFLEEKARLDATEFSESELSTMSKSTVQALWRRLERVLGSRSSVLRRDEATGAPLNLAMAKEDVVVVDIHSIQDPHLQRFVIAAALDQLVKWRTGDNAAKNETFLVVIDELNRYAPRGASDPITKMFEYVASQMRSRGIILYGAQQQGSRVSEVVIENSQTRVLGRSGGQELTDPIWRGFSEGDRKLALRLGPGDKVIVAPNFREALHITVPRPPWAMRQEDEDIAATLNASDTRAVPSAKGRRLQAGMEV